MWRDSHNARETRTGKTYNLGGLEEKWNTRLAVCTVLYYPCSCYFRVASNTLTVLGPQISYVYNSMIKKKKTPAPCCTSTVSSVN